MNNLLMKATYLHLSHLVNSTTEMGFTQENIAVYALHA